LDQDIAKRTLAEVEQHNINGCKHIARQREIIAQHILEGVDAFDAEELLALLKESQVLHERHRDRLRQELGLV
jgi:hypothetical protein